MISVSASVKRNDDGLDAAAVADDDDDDDDDFVGNGGDAID